VWAATAEGRVRRAPRYRRRALPAAAGALRPRQRSEEPPAVAVADRRGAETPGNSFRRQCQRPLQEQVVELLLLLLPPLLCPLVVGLLGLRCMVRVLRGRTRCGHRV